MGVLATISIHFSNTLPTSLVAPVSVTPLGPHSSAAPGFFVSLFPPDPPSPPPFFSAIIQDSPFTSTVHNRHHILSTFLPSPGVPPPLSVSTGPALASSPERIAPSASIGVSPQPSKPATPKRSLPEDDLVVDIATGLTGLEACSTSTTTSSSHPIPLFRSIAAHSAAQRLSSAVSARIAILPESGSSHPSPEAASSHPSPARITSSLLNSAVSPGTADASVSLLNSTVSPCTTGACFAPVSPPLLNFSVSPSSAHAS